MTGHGTRETAGEGRRNKKGGKAELKGRQASRIFNIAQAWLKEAKVRAIEKLAQHG